MNPCLTLNRARSNLCCWGRRPTIPIGLHDFCDRHHPLFLQYLMRSYFVHNVKVGLFVSTQETFFIIFLEGSVFQVVAWKRKPLPKSRGMSPLHFQRTVNGKLTLDTVVELLLTLDNFQMCALLETSLKNLEVLRYVRVELQPLDVRRLLFDASIPAFIIPENDFIPVDVLSAPFVMLLNGSTTPDPRLFHSGTLNLWNTMVGKRHALQNLRYATLVVEIKPPETNKLDFPPFYLGNEFISTSNRDDSDDQFNCDL